MFPTGGGTSPRVDFPMRFSMTSCRGFAVSKQCAYSFALFLKGLYTKNPWFLLPPTPPKKTMKNCCPQRKTELPGHQCSTDLHHIFAPLAGLTAESEARNCQFWKIFGQKNPLTYPFFQAENEAFQKGKPPYKSLLF